METAATTTQDLPTDSVTKKITTKSPRRHVMTPKAMVAWRGTTFHERVPGQMWGLSYTEQAVDELDKFLSTNLNYMWLLGYEYADITKSFPVVASFIRARAKSEYGVISGVLRDRLVRNIAFLSRAILDHAGRIVESQGMARILPEHIQLACSLVSAVQDVPCVGTDPPPRQQVSASSSSPPSTTTRPKKRAKTSMIE